MEGPSLVILREELKPFLKQKVLNTSGNSKEPISQLKGRTLDGIETWGKILFLKFKSSAPTKNTILTKTHFLMFGSYRINDPKENRDPRVEFRFPNGILYFYACSFLMGADVYAYRDQLDPEVDILGKHWNPSHVFTLLEEKKRCLPLRFFFRSDSFCRLRQYREK